MRITTSILLAITTWTLAGATATAGPPDAPTPATASGTLRLTAQPWAKISVDGKDLGITPATAVLTAGDHKVRLTKGEESENIVVTIVAGKTLRIHVDMADDGAKLDWGNDEPEKDPNVLGGISAYHRRQWSAAIQIFDALADGSAPQPRRAIGVDYAAAIRARGADYAAATRVIQDALNQADAAGANSGKAASAYAKAYQADKKIDGFHGSDFANKTADALVGSAKLALAAQNFGAAVEAARQAQNYADRPEAVQIEKICLDAAPRLLQQAKDSLARKEFPRAKDTARQVVRILPAADPRSQEARTIIKEASDGIRGDKPKLEDW